MNKDNSALNVFNTKHGIFFGENGLTSTSANHVANLAKEAYAAEMSELESIQLYDESLSLLGSVGETPISTGSTSKDLAEVRGRLSRVSALKSLIAWLREAIKARIALGEMLNDVSLREYCEYKGIEYPEMPEREPSISEEDYLASLNIKERNAYFELETRCSTLGKFIHENGSFSNARKRLNNVLSNPNVIRDSGRDTTILHRKPSVKPNEVEDLFFELQAEHRKCQAQLNALKHRCDEALEADLMRKNQAYSLALQEYNDKMAFLRSQFDAWKTKEILGLKELKIVIPDSLKPIYDMVSALCK